MRGDHIVFIEDVGPEHRLYEAVVVHGYPTKNGRPVRCLIDPGNQRIEVSDTVPEDDRKNVIARALAGASVGSAWTLVPYLGRVS